MEFVDHLFWRDTNCANEKRCLVSDYYVCELRKLALGIVILGEWVVSEKCPKISLQQAYIRLSGITANLGNKQINTERRVLVLEVFFDIVDRLLQHLGVLVQAANNPNAT